MSLAERLATFDFKNMNINQYNVLLELICMYSPSECEAIINERIVDEANRAFMLGELARFYQVASLIKR
jgi:hypothetical protein